MDCNICGGVLVPLGRCGRHELFECDCCGAEYNSHGGNLNQIDDIVKLYEEYGGEG